MSSSGPPPALPAGEILQLKIITTDMLVESLWLGVQAVVTSIGIYVLWSRGLRKSLGNKVLTGVIVLLFSLSACDLASTTWAYMATFDELGGTFDATPITNKVTILSMVFQRTSYFISDAIVVWRAWLLWDRNLFVKMLLVVCLLGTITATFVQGALAVKEQIRPDGGVPQETGTRTLMFSLPLLITNVVATTLIGLKIWEYRRNIMSHLSGSKTRVFSILLILLESSVLYCVCWILAMLGTLGGIFSPIAMAAIMGSLPYVTCIYPIAIVILVTIDKDNYGSTIQSTNTTMRFNNPVVTSTINSSGTRIPEPTYFQTKKNQSADNLSSSEKL